MGNRTTAFFTSPFLGGIGALLSAIWDGFWLVGPPIGIGLEVGSDQRHQFVLWGFFALCIAMVQAFVTLYRRTVTLQAEIDSLRRSLDVTKKRKDAREAIGRLLEKLSLAERFAHDEGKYLDDYYNLHEEIDDALQSVSFIASEYLDDSFRARFEAVTVHDEPVDDEQRRHFNVLPAANFVSEYQKIRGWRKLLKVVLSELGS